MKKLFILLLFFSIFSQTALSLRINEIMYNPEGDDNNKEFVEIYHTEQINLTNWIIKDTSSNDTLILLKYSLSNYSLIVEDDFNHSGISASVYSAGATIGNNLGNSGDTIYLHDNNTNLMDTVTYDDTYADGNGKSLSLINETWIETDPTPGYENIMPSEEEEEQEETSGQDIKLEAYIDDEIYITFGYTKLFKIINVNPEFGKAYNITVDYNITKDSQLIKQDSFIKNEVNQYSTTSTGSFTATEAGIYELCGIIISSTADDTNPSNDKVCKTITVIDTSSFPCNISINISSDKNFYLDNETIKFYNNLNDESFPYTIEYWVEDLFGNIFKKKINTTNTNQKSYSPRINEQDLVLLMKNQVYALCSDSNSSDNSAEKMIIIKNTNPNFMSTEGNSSLEIEKLYDLGSDNKAKFGQTIRAKVNIYKGDTTKSSISLWIEDNNGNRLSKLSKTNAYQKFMNYILTLPVQIKPNCDYDFDDGIYKLIIEGLDEKDSRNIEIEDITSDLCEKTTIEKTKQTTGSFTYSMVDSPYEVFSGEEFTIQLSLKNDDDEKHKATVWSYVYRGSKCYCTDREENKQEVSISPEKEKIVTLKNKVIDAKPGDYKLKIKIIKDSQKTIRELTKEIKVIPSVAESAQPTMQKQPSEEISLESEKYPKTVYESTNIKTQKLIPIFIITLLTILSAVLLWKR